MGFLTAPILGVSIANLIFTVKFIQALGAHKPETGSILLRHKLHQLSQEHPAAGMNHGISAEVAILILAAVFDGFECFVTFTVLYASIFHKCFKNSENRAMQRFATEWESEHKPKFDWKPPSVTYGTQVLRLIVLGSIWNKGTFYGLFCWEGGPVLRWQDVVPHLLEVLWGHSHVGTPLGVSRSGLPNACTYDHVANSIRGTLLLSFVTFFVVLPANYAGCLWNFEGSPSCATKLGYAIVTAWAFVWGLVINFLINAKVMLSLGALLSVQAFYLGIHNKTAQLVLAILACVAAAAGARGLWVMMQSLLRVTMLELGLLSQGPPESNYRLDTSVMTVAGILSIVLYSLCAGPLKHSSIIVVDFAVGIAWLVFSTVFIRVGVKLLQLPSACSVCGLLCWSSLNRTNTEDDLEAHKGVVALTPATGLPAPVVRDAPAPARLVR